MARGKRRPGMWLGGIVASGGEDWEQTRQMKGVGGVGRRDGVQSWLVQSGRGISGHTQHSHDVGIARARSPACHHNHQVSNVEEATKLSWGRGRR